MSTNSLNNILTEMLRSNVLNYRQLTDFARAIGNDSETMNRWQSAISDLVNDRPSLISFNEDVRPIPRSICTSMSTDSGESSTYCRDASSLLTTLADKTPAVPRVQSIVDLVAASDEEFARHINVPRLTIKAIFESVELLNGDFEYNDLITLLWYLSSQSCTVNEVAKVCRIPVDKVLPKLEEISKKLLCLKNNAMMNLPELEDEEDDIVEFFKKYAQIPDALGALGLFNVNCLDRSKFTIVCIVDHKRYFRHLHITQGSGNIHEILQKSPIYDRLQTEHPKGYMFLCPSPGYPTLPQLLPSIEGTDCALSPYHSEYALHHNRIVNVARLSVADVFLRFPKVDRLETYSPQTITAAFLLHNMCVQMKEEPTLIDSEISLGLENEIIDSAAEE